MLEIDNLCGGYGDLTVLKGVNMRISAGDMVGLIGANGAGKTTLVRTICGLVKATSGKVSMKGRGDITNTPAHLMPDTRVVVVLENRNLFGELSIRDNLALAWRTGQRIARANGEEVRFSIEDIFKLFPLIKERYETMVSVLSGGQQQMVAIARALLLQPHLLIMDEPSTGLAPVVVKDILAVLKKLRENGMSMLLVEQNVAIASDATDRCYVMSLGKIVHEIGPGEWASVMDDGHLVKAYLGG